MAFMQKKKLDEPEVQAGFGAGLDEEDGPKTRKPVALIVKDKDKIQEVQLWWPKEAVGHMSHLNSVLERLERERAERGEE